MRRHRLSAACVIVIGSLLPALAGTLPVDEDVIVREMEALIDATPDPDDKASKAVDGLLQKGIKAHDSQQFDKAIDYYRRALAAWPLSDVTYYEMAFTYTTMGQQREALDAAIRALVLNPKVESYHILKASILDDLGFRDEAEQAYRKLLSVQPESYLGHLNLGITLARAGDAEEAEAEFLRAIEIQPDHPSGYFHIARLYDGLGYNYDEQTYLEKFLEVGRQDPRLDTVKQRLEKLRSFDVVVDSNHPYPEIEIVEELTRTNWKSMEHRKRFPSARGYALTYEEDKDVYTTVLGMWREKKKEDPDAEYGPYDLLLQIDDAGFLDEYIWYRGQRAFGDRGARWLEEHEEGISAFLGWARSAGLLADEPAQGPVSPLDRLRALPIELLQVVANSDLVYRLGAESDRPSGLLEDDRERFARDVKLGGSDRIDCGKASRIVDEQLPKVGARALLPAFRCFSPGQPGYEQGVLRAAGLGLETREIEFRPQAALMPGKEIGVYGDATWLFYALAKAAWRNEAGFRERHGGSGDGKRASLEEEAFALRLVAGAYANALDPDSPSASAQREAVAAEERPQPPAQPIPALERLVQAVKDGHLRGYLLYEVCHKAYGLPLDRLGEEDASQLSDYLFGYVIFRTTAE